MNHIETDAIVIGSGFGGAPPAFRLARAGYRVLIAEKGLAVKPKQDFKMTQDPSYMQKYYKQYDGKGFGITAVEGLGGGSNMYLAISLRTPSKIFNEVDNNGNRYWPKDMSRRVLDPYFEKAEKMLKVSQSKDSDISKNGQIFAKMMKNLGMSADRTRLAVEDCQKCGFCITGCTFDAKQSLIMNYLPGAMKYGAKVVTETEAECIKPIKGKSDYKYEVILKNRKGEKTLVKTKIVVVAGGVVGSAKLLLKSKKYLKKMSNQVGKKLSGNIFFKTLGILPDHMEDAEAFTGFGLPGMVSWEYFEKKNLLLIPYKALPLQMFARIQAGPYGKDGRPVTWGQGHVDFMKRFRTRTLVLAATGFLRDFGSLELKGKNKVDIELKISQQLRDYNEECLGIMNGVLEKNGCEVVYNELTNWRGELFEDLHFNSTHPTGSCRMADTPENGVVNSDCELFGHEGIFVSDGAAVPSSVVVPPSLTIAAVAEKAADAMLNRLQEVNS